MTPHEFKAARAELGLTQPEIGVRLGDESESYSVRTVASWEGGERKIPPAVSKLIRLMIRAKRKETPQ